MKINQPILAFNRGIISPLAQARIDIERVNLSSEIQTNWMPRVFGSMMLRPGLEYTGNTNQNLKAIHIPFIFSRDDTAIIEFTNNSLRVKIDETPITRPSVSAIILNGDFTSDVANWTDNDESGATSSWSSSYSGSLLLKGDGTQAARRTQAISISESGTEHAVRIKVERGPVQFRIGSTSGGDDYFSEATLGTGTHSLAFTPTGTFYVDFYSRLNRNIFVGSIEIESAGIMVLPTIYTEDLLPLIRNDQSADVVYLACDAIKPQKLERRGIGRSWSIVDYLPEDGPFRIGNTSTTTLTPGALFGNTTLTADISYFRTTNVGSLFKLVSSGQTVTKSISTANDFTDTIEVIGVENARAFSIIVTGTFSATWHLQRSFDGGSSWLDVSSSTTTSSTSFNDGLTNTVALYRLGVKTGNYTSGTLLMSLVYSSGSKTGICRVTDYVSETVVNVEVLQDFGNTTETFDWAEGEWSERRGYPSAVCLGEGRLCWSGKSKFLASVSDAFESFSDDIEGDAGTISYNLGAGAVDSVNWMVALYRIFIGTQTNEKNIKTSSFEEPITPTNFKISNLSSQGSVNINPAKLDTKLIYVQSGGVRLYEINYSSETNDYQSIELSDLYPEAGLPSITRLAIQRHPDTRVHCVRSDGKVAVLLYEPLENLKGWIIFETDGEVEDVFTLPGDIEDKVYYSVKRIVNGLPVRYLERWALESECEAGTLNKQADSFIEYSGASTSTITGLSYLEGKSVVVWGSGKDLGSYTVSSGSITLNEAVTSCIVGLPYTAQYKSMKLAYASQSPLNQVKRINQLGLILYKTHYQGLKYGPNFDNLDNLPLVENGKKQSSDTIYDTYDKETFEFEGSWDTDARICLQAQAPRPCTILGLTFQISTNDK
jgi:hypothetical protein